MTNNTNAVNNVDTKSFYISIFAPLMGLQEFQKYVQDGYVLDVSQSPRKRGNNVHLTLVKVTPVGDTVKVDTKENVEVSKTTVKKPTLKSNTKGADKVEVKDV